MEKRSITHFVGFVTQLDQDLFLDQWTQQYFRGEPHGAGAVQLYENAKGKLRYKYISQHSFNKEDFSFSFLKDRNSGNFPERSVRVLMLGGYKPVETGHAPATGKSAIKISFFFNHFRADDEIYQLLIQYPGYTTYHPFYENCVYELILELILDEAGINSLLEKLKKDGPEYAIYRKCKIPHSVA